MGVNMDNNGGKVNNTPFRFWCQKVLPLVYDDSISYYELLNKVVVYLNNTIADVGNCEYNIEQLLGSFNALQEYMNDIQYFCIYVGTKSAEPPSYNQDIGFDNVYGTRMTGNIICDNRFNIGEIIDVDNDNNIVTVHWTNANLNLEKLCAYNDNITTTVGIYGTGDLVKCKPKPSKGDYIFDHTGTLWYVTGINNTTIRVNRSGSVGSLKFSYSANEIEYTSESGIYETSPANVASALAGIESAIENGGGGGGGEVTPSSVANAIANMTEQQAEDSLENLGGVPKEYVDTAMTDAVEAWLDEHITQPTNPVVDNSLSISGAAADAKATGDAIAGVLDVRRDISFEIAGNGYINYSNGNSSSSSVNKYTDYIDLSGYTKIIYKRQLSTGSSVSSGMAFYDKNNVYISGIQTIGNASANGYTDQAIDIPINAKYARFTAFQSASYGEFNVVGITDYGEVYNDTKSVENNLIKKEIIYGTESGSIQANTGNVATSNTYDHTDYTRITGLELQFTQIATSSTSAVPGLAFYDENKNFIVSQRAVIQNETGYVMQDFMPPDNAVYYRATIRKNVGDYGNFFIVYKTENIVNKIYDEINSVANYPLGLHVRPDNQGVVNAIKRARQMCDIVWSPAFDLDRALFYSHDSYPWSLPSDVSPYRSKYASGQEFIGLPYNEPFGDYNMLGIETPIDVFASAVRNSNSVEALESAYTQHGASYYACTCTGLTCYALDLPYIYSSAYTAIPGMINTYIVLAKNMDLSFANSIKLCDILQIGGHCAIITDIIKENDNVVLFEICEQTRQGNTNIENQSPPQGALCRRYTMTPEELCSYFIGFKILRYSKLDKVEYYPSLYSPVGAEIKRLTPAFNPIMPYMGDYSTHDPGNVKLLINNAGFDYLVVEFNGVELSRLTITDLSEVTVNCTNEGVYNAYMINLNNDNEIIAGTISCHWYIRPTNSPTCVVNNGVATISYVSKGEFVPYAIKIGNKKYLRIYNDEQTVIDNGDDTYTYSFDTSVSESLPVNCVLMCRSNKWGCVKASFTMNA